MTKDTKSQKSKEKLHWILFIIIVILIIAGIVIYCVSLGNLNFIDPIENNFIKRNLWIDRRIKKLNALHLSKSELKLRLEKIEQRVFLYTRIGLVLLFSFFNATIFFRCGQDGFYDCIESALNMDQVILLIYLSLTFIFTKKVPDISYIFRIIHLKIRKIIYRNFVGIESDLESIKQEIIRLEGEKKSNFEKIKKMKEKEVKLGITDALTDNSDSLNFQ